MERERIAEESIQPAIEAFSTHIETVRRASVKFKVNRSSLLGSLPGKVGGRGL